MVGAVLVRDGRIIAHGYHRRFGGPHAEIEALRDARRLGVNAAGSDLYVTLEPCSHHGKTPPCVDALVEAGLRRVVVAMIDPNPLVAGQGIERLRRAGIAVQVGLEEGPARRLNEPFVKRVTTGQPWVIAKWAQTLDGRIAAVTGDSQWISNPISRGMVHRLRARVDAVMVGVGTVVADDPQLTARGVRMRRVARRVVVDPKLRMPAGACLLGPLDGSMPAPLTIAVNASLHVARPKRLVELESRGVEVIGLPASEADGSRLLLRPMLRHLADKHAATNVLIEGGSRLIGALLHEQLVDQVLVFVAPKLLADARALPPVQGGGPCQTIGEARRLSLRAVRRLDEDVMMDYRVV